VTGQIAGCGPHADPERRADRVQRQEPGKAHPGHAGDDPVGLAQHVEEPRDGDDLSAVPGEERLGPGHPLWREQHVPAEPGQQSVAALSADNPADAVARHRGHESDRGHHRDVQPARTRVDRGGDHHRFARNRDAEVLHQQQGADRLVSVPVQVRRDGPEQARQGRGRHPAALGPGEGISLAQALVVRSPGMAQSSGRVFYILVVILH